MLGPDRANAHLKGIAETLLMYRSYISIAESSLESNAFRHELSNQSHELI